MNDESSSRPKSMRRLRLLVAVAFGLVITAAVVALVIYQRGRTRLVAAESAVRERGEPLHASEITFDGPDAPPAVDEAIARLEAVMNESPGTDGVLNLDPESVEIVLEWNLAASARPLIEEFVSLPADEQTVSEGVEQTDYVLRLWARLSDPVASHDLSQRDRLAVEIARRLNDPLFELAHAVCSGARDTCETKMRALPVGELMPAVRIPGWIESVRVPIDTLPAFALEGNHEEALRRWMIAWRGAQRVRGMPFVFGDLGWKLVTHKALVGLRMLLSWIPSSVGLQDIERELRSIDVRADTLRGLIGERALGNDVFEAFGSSMEATREYREASAGSWLARLWLYSDRALYLETLTEGIRRSAMPYPFEPAENWERSGKEWPKWAVVSAMITPKISGVLESQANADAVLRVAIVALIARRGGAEAGRRAADSFTDPFDGKPLRTRVDESGVFVVWSIGSDLIDDAAGEYGLRAERAYGGDIAWRVRTP